jgi:hypothetical protein
MSAFLDTTGNSRLSIAICGRCSLKFPIDELQPDPNSPGLLVCGDPGVMTGKGSWAGGYGCLDLLDPYRLPPHEVEDITITMPRPDTHLFPTVSVAPGGPLWPVNQFSGDSLPSAQLPPDGVQPFVPD